jgi:RimJ/RimL family protein N-acetyltransferase
MGSYPKTVRLRDGTEVTLRKLGLDDLERSHRFFLSLPEEDRLSLRLDPTHIENFRVRLEPSDAQDHWRVIALAGDEIVAEATLHQPRYGWTRHTGELRCVVSPDCQGKGLGSILFAEIYQEATRRRIERLYGLVLREQQAAMRISEKLGFRAELVLSDHLRAPGGELQDVVVMTVNIRDLWRRLEDLMRTMDGQGRERH